MLFNFRFQRFNKVLHKFWEMNFKYSLKILFERKIIETGIRHEVKLIMKNLEDFQENLI